jgi:hypothetical protein
MLNLHTNVQTLNNSKLFAGLVVVILNIASKFVNFRLSKTVEAYLKHTFSRDVLVFCIVWMGSREIYIAALVTLFFVIFMDFLFNEESSYCILPKSVTSYHVSLLQENLANNRDTKPDPTVPVGGGGGGGGGGEGGGTASVPAGSTVATNGNDGYRPIQWD